MGNADSKELIFENKWMRKPPDNQWPGGPGRLPAQGVTVLLGAITTSGGNHTLTKTGSGTLYLCFGAQ